MIQNELCDILGDPKTKSHIRVMYKIGTVGLQESAFAIYDSSCGDSRPGSTFSVSDLLVPEIQPGDFFEVAVRSRGISRHDLDTLVSYDDDTDNWKEGEVVQYGEYALQPYGHLDQKSQTRIETIMNNLNYPIAERVRSANLLIQALNDRAEADRRARRDIKLVAHNHPQLPTLTIDTKQLVWPSLTDITSYLQLRQYNPSYAEMIVGSDGENHAALLYKAVVGVPQLGDYGESFTKKAKDQLIVAGFAVTTLRLRSNGSVHKSSLPDLQEFVTTTAH